MIENQRKNQDKKLRSGERQVREKLETIEYWHKWRYNEALKYIEANDKVLDLGCGCGYGSDILSAKAKKVIGVDDSEEAINYAKKYWKKDNIDYYCNNVFNIKENFDIVIAFEIIEHVKDTDKIFNLIRQWTKKKIILSVPHISVPLSRSKWHWRHFKTEEIENYIKSRGFVIERIETPKFGKGLAIFCVGDKIK